MYSSEAAALREHNSIQKVWPNEPEAKKENIMTMSGEYKPTNSFAFQIKMSRVFGNDFVPRKGSNIDRTNHVTTYRKAWI